MGGILPAAGDYDGDLFYAGDSLFIWSEEHGWQAISAGDSGPPVYVGENEPPNTPQTGELWYCTDEQYLTLFIYTGTTWAAAAPPVSLDGIEAGIAGLTFAVDELKTITTGQGNEIADAKSVQYGFATAIKHLDDDQKRQDEKISELEGEVDDLKPTIERGVWTYNASPENVNNPLPGEYHAYVMVSDEYCKLKLSECYVEANTSEDPEEAARQCNRENTECVDKIGQPDADVPWHEVRFILLGKADDDGRLHDFGDVVPGMYVEAINLDGSGHGLYVIEDKSTAPVRTGLTVTPVHSTGHPNGKAVIKVFKMAEAANPEDYVKKAGDTMTGKLHIKSNTFDALIVQGSETHANSIFYVQDGQAKTKFRVRGNGQVQAGLTADGAFMAEEDHDLTTKKYVDDKIRKFISGIYGAAYRYKVQTKKQKICRMVSFSSLLPIETSIFLTKIYTVEI